MKRFFNPCRRHRPDLALLAAGVLPEAERTAIEVHLAACAPCQKYFTELQGTAATLAGWAESQPPLQPRPEAREHWAESLRRAANPKTVSRIPVSAEAGGWWRDVIWSSRLVWVGLAAVWVFILIGHFSLQDHPRVLVKASPPITREVLLAYQEQQHILNELLADRSGPLAAERPRFVPKPRSETMDIRAA